MCFLYFILFVLFFLEGFAMAKFWNYFFGKESDKNRVVKDDAGEEPEDKMSNLEFIAHYKDLLKL